MANQLHTAASNVSVLVPSVWSRSFYETLLTALPFNSIINRNYEGEIQALGNTVKISTVPEFSDAEDLAENASADADAVTVTSQSLVINQQTVKDFIVTDVARLQSLPFVDELQGMATYAILKKIQADIIADIAPSTSSPDHAIAYDSGTTLGLADILEAKELLDEQNVPLPDRHCVLGSAQTNDIFNISNFTSSDFVSGSNLITSGVVGNPLLGFQPHMTTAVSSTSYFFHRSFYTMAAQKGLTVKMFDLEVTGLRGVRLNTTTLWGKKQLSNLRVVTIS